MIIHSFIYFLCTEFTRNTEITYRLKRISKKIITYLILIPIFLQFFHLVTLRLFLGVLYALGFELSLSFYDRLLCLSITDLR